MFRFCVAVKLRMMVKQLTTDCNWEVVQLLKESIVPHSVCIMIVEDINAAHMTKSLEPFVRGILTNKWD